MEESMKSKFRDATITTSENGVTITFLAESVAADFRIWWDRSGSASFKKWKERGDSFYTKNVKDKRCANCCKEIIGDYCETCYLYDGRR